MNDLSSIIERINQDIDKIKVIDCKKEEVLCNSKFISLSNGKYKLNNGDIIERECIINKIGSGRAVCIFAVTENNKILIVIQPRVVLNNNSGISVEVPAGYVEIGEDSIEAGRRELEEETGYEADRIIKLDSYYTSVGFSDEIIDLILAIGCRKVNNQSLDDDEVIYVEEVSLEEFEYLLNNNYIVDVNTKFAYCKYLEYLRKKDSNEEKEKKN